MAPLARRSSSTCCARRAISFCISDAENISGNPTGTSFSFPVEIPTNSQESFLNLSKQAVTVTLSQVEAVFQAEVDIQLTVGVSDRNSHPLGLQWARRIPNDE